MVTDEDVRFMKTAIEAALDGQRTPGGEGVGAVLARDGKADWLRSMKARSNIIQLRTPKWWRFVDFVPR